MRARPALAVLVWSGDGSPDLGMYHHERGPSPPSDTYPLRMRILKEQAWRQSSSALPCRPSVTVGFIDRHREGT